MIALCVSCIDWRRRKRLRWSRDLYLQISLGYTGWRNFVPAIEKATESCKTSNHAILDHFVDANKLVPVPKDRQCTSSMN